MGIAIEWEGSGVDEIGVVRRRPRKRVEGYQRIVAIDPALLPGAFPEVDTLLGDPRPGQAGLGSKVGFNGLVGEMMREDLKWLSATQ